MQNKLQEQKPKVWNKDNMNYDTFYYNVLFRPPSQAPKSKRPLIQFDQNDEWHPPFRLFLKESLIGQKMMKFNFNVADQKYVHISLYFISQNDITP